MPTHCPRSLEFNWLVGNEPDTRLGPLTAFGIPAMQEHKQSGPPAVFLVPCVQTLDNLKIGLSLALFPLALSIALSLGLPLALSLGLGLGPALALPPG